VQRALGHGALKPLQRRLGRRVEPGLAAAAAVGLKAGDIWEEQRVVVAPLVGCAEVAAVVRFEPPDRLGQQAL